MSSLDCSSFDQIIMEYIASEVLKSETPKATQGNDIATKVFIENSVIQTFIAIIATSLSLETLKGTDEYF